MSDPPAVRASLQIPRTSVAGAGSRTWRGGPISCGPRRECYNWIIVRQKKQKLSIFTLSKSTAIKTGATCISLVFHSLAAVQFILCGSSITGTESFGWQFAILMMLSLVLSVVLYFSRTIGFLILCGKLVLYLLICYPMGAYLWIELSLLLAYLVEAGVYLSDYLNTIMMVLALVLSGTLHTAHSAFYQAVPAASPHDRITVMCIALVFGVLVSGISYYFRKFAHREKRIHHLDSVISQISNVNLSFQHYLHSVEYEVINSERKRLSREIHDTVGYSLTNILMTLEAASSIVGDDSGKTGKLIKHSIVEARDCLEQTRASMRALRNKDLQRLSGNRAIAHLIHSFEDATGIAISIEYGNVFSSFDPETDRVVFRFVQESLTNAFRHGMCSKIQIRFWINDENILLIGIRDNGVGAMDIVEGIGLKGMRERIESIQGRLTYHSSGDGFELRAHIPLFFKSKEIESDTYGQNPAGFGG